MRKIIKNGVLIADPSGNMASLVAMMLRAMGHRLVTEVTTARDLRAVLQSRSFSLIVLDDSMGPPDAVGMVHRMRKDGDHTNRTTPIIMTSAAPDVGRIAEARDAGVTEFLRKPFSASDLQKRIASLDLSPRRFIDAPAYAGPDRRRRALAIGDDQRTG